MTEDVFLADLLGRLPAADSSIIVPPGDDCAALDLGGEGLLLLAVDQVVGDKHYLPEDTSPEAVGRKLLARNLSDVAAMGGTPTHCLVASATSPGCGGDWLARFFDGILEMANAHGVQMVGGDLACAPSDNVASLTILGRVLRERVLLRSGARPGDVLLATGTFGESFVTEHHLFFEPRCREGVWLADSGIPTAMMDVSDGLLLDASRVCKASGVSLLLDCPSIPRRRAETTLSQALSDGEDYELLLAVPSHAAAKLLADWPFDDVLLTRIGRFVERGDGLVLDEGGQVLPVEGYDHLDGTRP
ncbi:MAG: thiamine-phosphate kinase [Lentisphaeria bacterium]|nr:thiamine-phosphate kinase [Lentisphaeria bacterium]